MTTTTDAAYALHQCAVALSARCDGAIEEDGAGFSKPDAYYGNHLATTNPGDWDAVGTRVAFEVLRKYRDQLGSMGIDFAAIAEPPKVTSIDAANWKGEAKAAIREAKKAAKIAATPVIVTADAKRKGWVVISLHPALSKSLKAVAAVRKFDWDAKRWHCLFTHDVADWVAEHGTDVADDLPKPKDAPETPKAGITLTGNVAAVRFPYNRDAVAAIKRLNNRKFNAKDEADKHWVVTLDNAEDIAALIKFAADWKLGGAEPLAAMLDKVAAADEQNLTGSTATDADIVIEGLGEGLELMPFQKAGVAYALRQKRTFIADEMGLGKTVQAIAAMQAADAFPALVVVPASLKLNWQREVEKWLPGRTVQVLSGSEPNGEKLTAEVIVINYDLLGYGLKPKADSKRGFDIVPGSWVEAIIAHGADTVIADEAHYLKSHKAKRSNAVELIIQKTKPELVLFLTGTPFLNRPAEGINQLKMLGRLNGLGGWYKYATRYCGAYDDGWGWKMGGAANLKELNTKLRQSCFVRRLKAEVLTELPAKRRVALPMEIDNRKAYDAAASDVVAWFGARAVADAQFNSEIADLSPEDAKAARKARAASASQTAARAEQLARFTALKQVAAEGKMTAALEWINNFTETGEKLVVFAHHKAITSRLAKELNAPKITGDVSAEARQAAVDKFQTDPECKVIVLNMAAGGVGLTLTAASNVLFIELGWTPALHDQAEDRCHRIGQDNAVTAWYLLADNTIDTDIYALLEQKRKVVDGATDGRDTSLKATVMPQLIAKLMEGAS